MDEQPRRRLGGGEDGATAVEYAVMLGLIIAVAIVAIGTFGGGVAERWRQNAGQIIEAIGGAAGGP
jgi:Flp pilus assembly pilin Flp